MISTSISMDGFMGLCSSPSVFFLEPLCTTCKLISMETRELEKEARRKGGTILDHTNLTLAADFNDKYQAEAFENLARRYHFVEDCRMSEQIPNVWTVMVFFSKEG